MLSIVNRHVIARESNIVRVDFSREPDPPAPWFPGANGLRLSDTETHGAEAPTDKLGLATAFPWSPALRGGTYKRPLQPRACAAQ
jgi:hypothetical protein